MLSSVAAFEVKVKVGSVIVLPGAKTGTTAATLTARGNGDLPVWEDQSHASMVLSSE
jgi:hypothetical protein